MSVFCNVKEGTPVEVFSLRTAYDNDTFENKINLGIGTYRNKEGVPWVLPVVTQTEKVLAADETLDKEYLPVLGLEKFCAVVTKIVLGNESQAILENRVFAIQTVSGTGSLRVGAEFLARQVHCKTFYVSQPTWENYDLIFKAAGFVERKTYRYWNEGIKDLDIEGMLEDLRNAPENSVVLLNSCAHNPTGCDPTEKQWQRIADVIETKKLFSIIDFAYQGMASGDIEEDAWSLRYFVSRGLEFFCCQCFSKNFGLYDARIGSLICVVKDSEVITQVKSQLTLIIRGMYSNPPSHGARITTYILTNPYLFEDWKDSIMKINVRLIELRRNLREALEKLGTPGTWNHITAQTGLFSYIGLNEQQTLHMVHNFHIYMMRSGRINLSGLNRNNIDYVAKAIHETVTNLPDLKL